MFMLCRVGKDLMRWLGCLVGLAAVGRNLKLLLQGKLSLKSQLQSKLKFELRLQACPKHACAGTAVPTVTILL